MNAFATNKITKTYKFQSISLIENGLILKYKNKKAIEMPYGELEKVYIKKLKINPLVEFLSISFPFLFVYAAMQYVPFILLLLITVIVLILVFMRVIKYSWYQFCIVHKDQTLYKKQVPRHKKTEATSLLNKVQQGIFYYKSSTLSANG